MKSTIEIGAAKHALRARMGWRWGGKHTRSWHGLPQGIVGVGFGVKRTDGKAVAGDFIRVYVRNKQRMKDLTPRRRIPPRVNGYQTDVVVMSPVTPHPGPGGSIGNGRGVSGSLACVVGDGVARYLLGSWHVLTNTYGNDGDPVFMPSKSVNGGAPMVGSLVATPIFHLSGGSNAFDASVAQIQPGALIDAGFDAGRSFKDFVRASASAAVIKNGAATATTTGTIDGVSEDVPFMYNGLASDRAILTGQICIAGDNGAFSSEGDSGAMVCTPDLHPLGLIVGGATAQVAGPITHSFASPIGPILDFYQVSIET
jgi:hypothetical protein